MPRLLLTTLRLVLFLLCATTASLPLLASPPELWAMGHNDYGPLGAGSTTQCPPCLFPPPPT